MRKKNQIGLLLILCILMSGCQVPTITPTSKTIPTALPSGLPHNPYANPNDPYDYRGFDLSASDLRDSIAGLLKVTFDTRTKWPPREYLPDLYDPDQVLELGKNPGLGIRSLHAKGITGQGVNIAIVDAPLKVDHQEYNQRIKLYEEINIEKYARPEMHASAVASIAVGKSTGVAPEANLFYIAARTGSNNESGKWVWNFDDYARAIERFLFVNASLPEGEKIRVIALQIGFTSERADLTNINRAIQSAQEQGIFVVCSTLEDIYGFKFHGLGRVPLDNPDDFTSYLPGNWWEQDFFSGIDYSDHLMFPMDSRTTASITGDGAYIFHRTGGWSWVIPYIAGLYALVAQVEPQITPQKFWEIGFKTGKYIQVESGGQIQTLGPIIDPLSLINHLNKN